MSVTIKHLNDDSSFLLTFTPPIALGASDDIYRFPGSFTILIDPWIRGSSKILSPKFNHSFHTVPPCITSLAQIPTPDLVLISQDKPDHCHEETLRTLSPQSDSIILGPPAAAKKIRSWNHFDSELIDALRPYKDKDSSTVYRISIPPISASGSPGVVTIAFMPARKDITGLHNAVGITYRAPCSVLSAKTGSYVNLPPTPPESPPLPRSAQSARPASHTRFVSASPRTIYPSPYNNREKTISVLYSPHGVSYNIIRPYVCGHLLEEAALPLTCLLHSFDRVDNPWYLGGLVANGAPGGAEIARNLFAKTWISAHDEDKENRGLATKKTKVSTFTDEEIGMMLHNDVVPQVGRRSTCTTSVVRLDAGEEIKIE
ncbi:MAG: hypothetical protein M1820_002618 [Bogoriella megaspora]|nr:MAG: hypothetical protein M1820_002618 [Bogoriella megaspora]